MSDKYILDAQHQVVPCHDLSAWCRMFEDSEARRVGKWEDGESSVSTVFLGLDHGFGQGGPPVVFETLVFGGPLSDEMERYSTWDEAVAGHDAMVERVKAAHAAATI